jgi:hypothetical protein
MINDVKWIIKRFTTFLGRLSVMNHSDQPSEALSPVGVSSFACFVSMVFVYWVDWPAISLLQVWWAELLVYALIPILVTFIILNRSCWHREIAGAARTLSLILLSCIIFVGDLMAVVIFIILAFLVYSRFINGFTRFHG